MYSKTIVATVLVVAGVAACSGSSGLSEAERVLLEVEYINQATGPTYFGFHVDGSGDVYRYDRNHASWERQDSAAHTPEELSGKYAPVNNLLFTRPRAEVRALIPTIDEAALGTLSEPHSPCADAGTLRYLAYTYDPDAGRYTAVLLRVEGDLAQVNTSAAAQELIAYIRSLALLPELTGCDP
jgi:hypothetical protein